MNYIFTVPTWYLSDDERDVDERPDLALKEEQCEEILEPLKPTAIGCCCAQGAAEDQCKARHLKKLKRYDAPFF